MVSVRNIVCALCEMSSFLWYEPFLQTFFSSGSIEFSAKSLSTPVAFGGMILLIAEMPAIYELEAE